MGACGRRKNAQLRAVYYMYRIQPPVVARNTKDTLKEWNAPCAEDEMYSLENLKEFSGTDFGYLLVSKIAWLPPPLLPPPAPPTPSMDSLDNDSLYGPSSQSSNVVINENKLRQPCAQEEQKTIPGFNIHPESRTHEPKPSSSLPGILSHTVIPGFDLDAPLKVTLHEASVTSVENTASKKRRLSQELFDAKKRKPVVGSLYRVIPQPHMHPSPFLASNVPPSGIPYARPPLWAKLPSPSDDARVAWLIPVRGSLPWEGSTPAVLDDATVSSSARISWTQDSLVQFWDFLLNLQRAATFGSIGVAFHHASARVLPPVRSSSPGPVLQDPRNALPSVDFIKIYHNANWRLYLRSVLDKWNLQVDGEPRALKPLIDARLVLVDEVSQAILIV